MEPIKLKLTRQRVPVELEDEKGKILKLTLVEMDGTQRDEYLNDSASRMEIVPGEVDAQGNPRTRIKDYKGLHAKLLTVCLVDENGKAPTLAEVQAWPAAVQSALYKAAQELNRLDGKKEGDAKNA